MARSEASVVGTEMNNFHTLTTILLRAADINGTQLINLLQPTLGRFPQNQQQYDAMNLRLRSMGHILEAAPGNLMQSLRPQRNASALVTDTLLGDTSDAPNNGLFGTTPGATNYAPDHPVTWEPDAIFGWHQAGDFRRARKRCHGGLLR